MRNDLHFLKGNLLEEGAGDAVTQGIAASEDADGAVAMGQEFGDRRLDRSTPTERGGGERRVILAEKVEMSIAADDEGGLGQEGAIDCAKDAAIADAKDVEPGSHGN